MVAARSADVLLVGRAHLPLRRASNVRACGTETAGRGRAAGRAAKFTASAVVALRVAA